MVNEAKEALSKLASGAEVELRYGGTRTDRHGYALAQVYVVKGGERIWLQGELVAKGLARVYSFPDNHACVSELLAREAEARELRVRGWLEWRNGRPMSSRSSFCLATQVAEARRGKRPRLRRQGSRSKLQNV